MWASFRDKAPLGLGLCSGGAGGGERSWGGPAAAEAAEGPEAAGGEAAAAETLQASEGPRPGGPGETPPPGAPEEDQLYARTLELIRSYLREQAGAQPPPGGGPAPLRTLRRVAQSIQREHEAAFRGMLRRLRIRDAQDLSAVVRLVPHVFSDGVTSWGRIVTLISLGAFVAKHLKTIHQEGCVDQLAESLALMLVRSKRDWLVQHRGWEGFVEFFREPQLGGGFGYAVMALAGLALVAVGLVYLLRCPCECK